MLVVEVLFQTFSHDEKSILVENSRSLAKIEAKTFMIYVYCQSRTKNRSKNSQETVKRSWSFYSRVFISIQGYTKIIFRPLSYTQET